MPLCNWPRHHIVLHFCCKLSEYCNKLCIACLLVGIVKDFLGLVVRLDESVDTRKICTAFSQSYSLMIRFRPLSIAIDCPRRTNVASPVRCLQHLDTQVLVDLSNYLYCIADCEVRVLDAISFCPSLFYFSTIASVLLPQAAHSPDVSIVAASLCSLLSGRELPGRYKRRRLLTLVKKQVTIPFASTVASSPLNCTTLPTTLTV